MKTQNSPSQMTGHLQVILAMCIVGSSIAASKVITAEFPVFLASFCRFALASACLIPVNYLFVGKFIIPRRSEYFLLVMQAFFGVFMFSICLLSGLTRTTAVSAGVVLGMLPAVNAALSIVILKERLSLRYAVGVALSVLSAVLLESRHAGEASAGLEIVGVLLVFGAVVCEALFSIVGKLAGKSLPPIVIATWVSIIGMVLFAPMAAFELTRFNLTSVSARAWSMIAYSAIVVTVLGFTLFYLGLQKLTAVAAGVHMAWAPISALLFAVLLLDEPFGMVEAASTALVVVAVLVIAIRRPHSQSRSNKPSDETQTSSMKI